MGDQMRHKMKVNFSRSVPLGETWMKTRNMDPDDHTAHLVATDETAGDMEMKGNGMS